MRTIIIIVILYTFQLVSLSAQIGNKECKQKILDYYHDLEAKIKSRSSKTYHVEMSYTSYINEQVKQGIVKPKAISTSVKMYLHSERSCYENDEMLLFKDNKDVFSVLKNERIILRSPVSDEQLKQKSMMMDFFKDSLLIASKLTSCKHAGGSYAKTVIEVKLQLPEKYQKALKAEQLTIYFDEKNKKMLATEILFLKGHSIIRQIIKYNKEEFLNSKLLQYPVSHNFLNNKGQLLPKYNSYKYFDSVNQ